MFSTFLGTQKLACKHRGYVSALTALPFAILLLIAREPSFSLQVPDHMALHLNIATCIT